MQDNSEIHEFHWMTILLHNIDVGIVVLDNKYNIQVWNTFMQNHSGLRPHNVKNKNLFELYPDIPEKWFKRKCEAVFLLQNQSFSTWQQRPYLFKFENYRPITGRETDMYQNFTIFPITSLTGETESIALAIYDVTDIAIAKKQLNKTNQVLTKQNRIDALTQVYNRVYWESRVEHEFIHFKRYGNTSSLIMLDIDYFKKVNDTYGHLAGDKVICHLANEIKKQKRDSDLAGRYGGEEFGILLPNTNADNALVFAERLRQVIESSHVMYENTKIEVTISLGIAEFSNKADNYQRALSQADEALYISKGNGRNQVTVYKTQQLTQVCNEIRQTS